MQARHADAAPHSGVSLMPDADRLASTLAGIRDDNIDSYADGSTSDIPRLLKALEAVLKLADGARSLDDEYVVDTDSYRPVSWNLNPASVREAITAELNGKEAGDG